MATCDDPTCPCPEPADEPAPGPSTLRAADDDHPAIAPLLQGTEAVRDLLARARLEASQKMKLVELLVMMCAMAGIPPANVNEESLLARLRELLTIEKASKAALAEVASLTKVVTDGDKLAQYLAERLQGSMTGEEAAVLRAQLANAESERNALRVRVLELEQQIEDRDMSDYETSLRE